MKNYCSCIKKFRFGFLEHPLSELFYKHSLIVCAHPWPYIIIPLLISGGLGVGYFFRNITDNVYEMYTPTDALGLGERQTIKELFPALDGTFSPSRSLSWDGECDVIAIAKDGGSILRPEHRKAAIRMNDVVVNDIFVKVDNVQYSYSNICMKYYEFCQNNPQLAAIDLMMSNPEPGNNLTYPTVRRGPRSFYIGSTLGHVKLDPLSRQIVEAKAWQLTYQVKYEGMYKRVSQAWQLQYEKVMRAYKDDLLDIAIVHTQSFDLEIRRNGENVTMKFILCIIMLLTFASLCSLSVTWDYGFPYVDWTRSKPLVATAGLLGAIMGVVTTIGLLAFCGVRYDSAVDAMPFVVLGKICNLIRFLMTCDGILSVTLISYHSNYLGVRLDNTFLMISAVHQTKRTLTTTERVSEAMSESAMSITLTVLTDILSFACGIPTDFKAVQLFSIYTVVAMLITYMYQLTFLLGVLVLSMRAEEKNAHSLITSRQTVSPADNPHQPPLLTRLFCLGSHVKMPSVDGHKKLSLARSHSNRSQNEKSKVQYQEGTWISRMIKTHYAPMLMKTSTRIFILFAYILYLGLSIYGCTIMKVGLEPSKLLVDDSYAKVYEDRILKYFWSQGVQAHITFSNGGDLVDKGNRDRIFQIVDRFANSAHGMGKEGVTFWLNDFKDYIESNSQRTLDTLTNETFYAAVQEFLAIPELGGQYRNDIHWVNQSGKANITAFRALVGMKNFNTSLAQIDTVDLFRSIANEYTYNNVSTYHLMWVFVDQYEEVPANTAQEIYGGIAFMILIAVFLIPSVVCTFWVILAILSIDAGTFGFMTFWGINLDVISMICIIMSIGFSVDFTAHIAYHFVVVEGKDAVEKTSNSLGTLAWPILQGAISTTMGVVALAGGNSYMQSAFFKTVFIVILLGLIHALVFLPAVLSVFSCKLSTKYITFCCAKKSKVEDSSNDIHKPVHWVQQERNMSRAEEPNEPKIQHNPSDTSGSDNVSAAPVVKKKSVRIDEDSSNDAVIPEDPAV